MSLSLGGMIDLGMPWYFPFSREGKEMKFLMDWIVFCLISAMVSSKVSMYFSLRKSATSGEQFLVVAVVAFMMVLSSRLVLMTMCVSLLGFQERGGSAYWFVWFRVGALRYL